MFRRKRQPADFREEIESHLAHEAERLRREGMAPADAQSAARRVFGNVARVGEGFYETGRWIWWDNLAADLRYAARALRRTPAFALAAFATLALGIGANTAVFTVIHTVLLRPLPYPEAGRIVRISGPRGGSLSEPNYLYLAQHNPGLEDLSAYQAGVRMSLIGGDRAKLAEIIEASRKYFQLFGAHALLGRTFTEAEDSPGGLHVLLVSYGLWQQRFAGDASILGRHVTLGGAPFTVIGVLSPQFRPYPPADVWVPLQAGPNPTNPAGILTVAARLPAGTTVARANAAVAAIGRHYWLSRPGFKGDAKTEATRPGVAPLTLSRPVQQALLAGSSLPVGKIRTLDQAASDSIARQNFNRDLLGLFAAIALLLAAVGIYGVLSFGVAQRARELGIRAALGAERRDMLRLILRQATRMALLGVAVGLAAAFGLTRLLRAELFGVQPHDPLTFVAVPLTLLAVALLATAVPALRASRVDPLAALRHE